MLSHVKCWDWLLEQPSDVRYCLVLEDDACFRAGFVDAVWNCPALQHLRRQTFHGGWDVVVLGYFHASGLRAVPSTMLDVHDTRFQTLSRGGGFFGTHAYLVSRRGAAVLRQHAFPLEIQADAYLRSGATRRLAWPRCRPVVLQQLGWIRLFLVDAVDQCIGNIEGGIDHAFQEAPPLRQWVVSLRDRQHHHCVMIMAALLFVLFATWAVCYARHTRPSSSG